MQFMCLVAYGGQRWDIRTNVNEAKQISPLVLLMFLLYVLLMRRIFINKLLGLCFS
jgi:hypothetical protein